MKRFISYAAAALIPLLWTCEAAIASCAPPESPENNFQRSAAVFSGEVVRVRTSNAITSMLGWPSTVTLRVTQSWKGVPHNTVVLKNMAGTSVEFPFDQGQHYLVYAYYEGSKHEGLLTTDGCSGTKLLINAQEDLEVLGASTIVLQTADETPLPFRAGAITVLLLFGIVMIFFVQRRGRHS